MTNVQVRWGDPSNGADDFELVGLIPFTDYGLLPPVRVSSFDILYFKAKPIFIPWLFFIPWHLEVRPGSTTMFAPISPVCIILTH